MNYTVYNQICCVIAILCFSTCMVRILIDSTDAESKIYQSFIAEQNSMSQNIFRQTAIIIASLFFTGMLMFSLISFIESGRALNSGLEGLNVNFKCYGISETSN